MRAARVFSGVSVALLVCMGSVTAMAAPPSEEPESGSAAVDTRGGRPQDRGRGTGVKAPPAKGVPEWVREHVQQRRYTAPGRDKIRRTPAGKAPSAQARWTFEGTQSRPVEGPGRGGGGMSAALGSRAPAAAAAVDPSDPSGGGLGVLAHYGMEEFGIADGLSAAVNIANGNLVVRTTDIKINAPGVATRMDRFYNEQANRWGAYGKNWSMAGGHDVGLEVGATSVVWRGPSGFRATFTGSGSSWSAAPGVNATLTKNANGTWRVRAKGSGMTWDFTAGGFLTKQADRNGVGLSFTYTPNNFVASMTDAAGRVVNYTYDADQRVTKISDSAGREYTYTYLQGRLRTSTNPDGATVTYGYNYDGRLASIQTTRGVRIEFTFDTLGRVRAVSRFTDFGNAGEQQSTIFTYVSATSTTQRDPRGNTWTYTHDSRGRITSVKDPLGRTRSQTWTANSAVATTTDAMGAGGTGGNITKFSYDSANNPIQVAMPTGAITSALYTTGGACGTAGTASPDQPACITDDAGNSAAMRYDAMGNLLSRADVTSGGTGSSVSYNYQRPAGAATGTDCGGKAGQRCTATDGNGNTTRYGYDGDGNLTRITPPAPLGARTFEYDSLGRLIASTNGRGQRLTYVYDAQDRLLSTTIPAAPGVPARTVSQSWDGDGNLTYNDATISYDTQNRQSWIQDANGVGYSVWYDPAGNIGGINGGGQDHRYAYDAANQLTLAGWAGANCAPGTTGQSGCVKFAYDANGAETQRYLPGQAVTTTTRDGSGRPTRVRTVQGSTALFDQSYSYTKPGTTGTAGDRANIQSVTHTIGVTGSINHGSTTTYGYDTKNRLTAAVENRSNGALNASWAYGYDKADNRTTQTRTGSVQAETGTLTYTYNAAHQLTAINGNTNGLGYDTDGNETHAAGSDWLNIPARTVTTSPTGDPVTMTTANGALNYAYGGTNPGHHRMTWAHGKASQHSPIGVTRQGDDGGGLLNVLRDPAGKPLALQRDGQTGYYIQDRQGSIIGMTDDTGATLVSYAYDPYGNIRTAPGQNVPLAWWNPYTYTGALKDNANGLYRMGVRWYDPNTGRFTTPDPTTQETNPYTYASANPCNNTDPTGGSWEDVGKAAGLIFACGEGAIFGGQYLAGVGTFLGGPGTGTLVGGSIGAVYGCGFAIAMTGAAGGFNGFTNNPG